MAKAVLRIGRRAAVNCILETAGEGELAVDTAFPRCLGLSEIEKNCSLVGTTPSCENTAVNWSRISCWSTTY